MSRATLISRIVFALLVLATFTAFFAAQRLKRSDPLVYSVNVKRYVSPNGDGLRDRARLRFRTKEADVVTVEVIDRSGTPVRTLADRKRLAAGAHRFQWNGRYAPNAEHEAEAVPDGAYRVRITMHGNGRTFIPDKYFVVDTQPPQLTATVTGEHQRSILDGRGPVTVKFTGIEPSRRVQFLVYEVRGQRTSVKPIAIFANDRGKDFGRWDQDASKYRVRVIGRAQSATPCFGRLVTRGEGRPARVGSYVIVARACDAAGNVGTSSATTPPRRGSTRGASGVTLTGVQIAPPATPAIPGTVRTFRVAAPRGGYRYRLAREGGSSVASGRERGDALQVEIPRTANGLYRLTINALDPVRGDRGVARTPVVVSSPRDRSLLIVQPAIAWQATNPVDVNGDGFGDPFPLLPAGEQIRVPTDRLLATPAGTNGFNRQEGALAAFLTSEADPPAAEYTTDFALAAAEPDPGKALAAHDAVLFAGDERWITPQLGVALRKFVEQGGRVAFFAPDAFRRTVKLGSGEFSGPSERRQRDIFGEAVQTSVVAPAPVFPFTDTIGLLRGPTGLFTRFEQSQSRPRAAELLTDAGREQGKPALAAYSLGKGEVIRIGVPGWQAALATDPNVAYTMRAVLAELQK